jgi:hypothetical protein
MLLDIPERVNEEGNGSVIRADLPTEPRADAETTAGIIDTLRAMQACDRPGKERELGGFFSDDYYRRMALRYPEYAGDDLLQLPWLVRVPSELAVLELEDLPEPVELEDGRVALLLWLEWAREGELVIFVEQAGVWFIDETVRITEEPGQPRG